MPKTILAWDDAETIDNLISLLDWSDKSMEDGYMVQQNIQYAVRQLKAIARNAQVDMGYTGSTEHAVASGGDARLQESVMRSMDAVISALERTAKQPVVEEKEDGCETTEKA